MSMDITFLGTGSAYPSPHRGASALVLRTEGECWLFDCGEGTQTQLMKSAIRASKITKVFISHLHGDHFFGLPGLLCTLSLSCSPHGDQEGPHIEVYGPQGLRNFLRVALQISRSDLLLTYAVHELEPSREQSPCTGHLDPALTTSSPQLHPQERPGRTVHLDPDSDCYSLVHDQRFVVQAFQLYHRVPSFGFAVQERERPGRLKVELLKELGVNPGPLYGRLKNGQSVTLDSGRLLRPEEVLEPAVRGRKRINRRWHQKRIIRRWHQKRIIRRWHQKRINRRWASEEDKQEVASEEDKQEVASEEDKQEVTIRRG
ncbi:zinc phosphodiesterase ELAC protein 1 isoform X2 [Brachyhypopomus gauderio]|uniref:zinc phosphodiesterase ELAC protein 1 isoform X2 n=1 Tax=Brachyhypopomus gauderio TaxID=698409 RepID=UPI0040414EF2